ncbi:hypothetical protein D9756_002563 [Leucocoprinus leucothites]|uniref:Uncharacterized protein n=1 Tax=Leucocoprinus leucothites TaxID=201217 RepID=A0A8H5GBX2_9AGAR|nr:hypothetical protein D9756_002563 [Leucoagaricus leucothites]
MGSYCLDPELPGVKHDAVLTVDDVSRLTNSALANSLAEPDPSLLTFSSPAGQASPQAYAPPKTQVDTTTTAGSVLYNTAAATANSTPPLGSPITQSLPPNLLQQQYQNHQQPIQHHHSFTAIDMGRSYSQPVSAIPPTAPTMNSMNYIDLQPAKRAVSESTPGLGYRHSSSAIVGGGGGGTGSMKIGTQISNFLRRKKRSGSAAAAVGWGHGGGSGKGGAASDGGGGRGGYGMGDVDESQESDDTMPPPTPPKDKGVYTPTIGARGMKNEFGVEHGVEHHPYPVDFSHVQYSAVADVADLNEHEPEPELMPSPPGLAMSESSFTHAHSISEYAVISHEHLGGGGQDANRNDNEADIVVLRPEEFGLYGIAAENRSLTIRQEQQSYGINTLKKGKWAEPQGLTAIRDPAERARLRMEMQKQKMEEEKEVLRAEEERQERLKWEKEESMRREEEEAEGRKARIQAEALRVAAERRRREEMEREEEERRRGRRRRGGDRKDRRG